MCNLVWGAKKDLTNGQSKDYVGYIFKLFKVGFIESSLG